MIPVHVVLMPDGRVLTYGNNSGSIYDVWDPSAGLDAGHLTLPNTTGTSLFCSAQLVLPEGTSVFIAGGGSEGDPNIDSNVFDYGNDTLTRNDDMTRPRYYASTTTLLDGNTYIQGGSGGTDHPEIRKQNGGFQLLNGADTSGFDYMYPRNVIAPDGRVFGYDGNGKMFYVSTGGSGAVTSAGQFAGPIGTDSSAAMFRPGRILQFGGNSSGALVIDITGGQPIVTSTQSLSSQRRWVNATILADGKVLAIGGSEVKNEMVDVNYSAEIWDPSTGQWTRGANADRARLYHSTALLLPDATVLVGGGGSPGPQFNTNVEVYYPPYLYDASGAWAVRPSIGSAPTYMDIGQTFVVDLAAPQEIHRVAVVKTGSVSHGFNFEQRFIELTFQQNGSRLNVQAPTHASDAPPGFYLLFVINSVGTPSVGRIVKVGVAATPDAEVTPSLDDPGNQTGQVGTSVVLQLSATDPNDDTLNFGAAGLPPGLEIDDVTGLISGTPMTAGTFNVVAIATDGVNSDSESFLWTVTQVTPSFTLYPPPIPAPALAGTEVTFQASVTGGSDLQYKWDFDDGSPETPYAASPSITHTFAEPGIYYVMVTVVDAGGIPQMTTVVQTVHLPLTANRPAVSGNLAVEERATGADRLWVVNQDNDSVSVFNTTTNAKVAEITVGSAPRSLAIAPTGEIWVTNKQSATISVIDPASLAVNRTIALPFASQPFGIVAAPTGDVVYVALEGTGRLLTIDVDSYTLLASLDVGPRVRHLSVTGDGSLVYASRFITPPLPDESTANVRTEVGGQPRGGEIAVINSATMTLQQTIILRHSDKPDFENQGRGIPNYLGAVAISPDGQSAWVPSKQDNIQRGVQRDGLGLNFQSTVRAISSRLDLATGTEDYAARIDHDDSGVASAVVHDRLGIYMFVALETSREVAIVDAHSGWEIFRIITGRAPQGLALSIDGRTLYVSNFMDRTVSVFDIATLLQEGIANMPLVATVSTVGTEKLTAPVLQGKQFFYDAKDTRLARDAYLSCASCHNDGGHDGRVWDLTGFGEGLRNTISLRGRAGAQGFLHWSNNFDEVQDFEGQIRSLSGGSGLMTNVDFNAGTRSQPLGGIKAGRSSDLDALAAYVASLNQFASSPLRNADGSLTAAATAGREVFRSKNCAACHGGTAFTNSGNNNPENVGTITSESGSRLGGPLTGIDVPTLRDVWATGPHLHRGSVATIGEAILAHQGISLTATELANLSAYVSQIGDQETAAPTPPPPPGGGTGAFQQAGDGTVSMEAEHFSSKVDMANYTWTQIAPAGASGGGAMLAPKSQVSRMEYQVSFSRTGTHYVYLRSYGSSGASDSAWVGFNGNWQIQYVRMKPLLSWQWEGPVQINVTSTGVHTIGITRRESDAQVDKIVILPNAIVPSGTGPAESGRDGGGGPINNHPTVDITSPTGSISVTEGTSISFSATASDIEDGNLSANLNWNSSRDGLIGLNASFSTSTLSVGTHTITASVSDSNLDTGSDSVTVTVTTQIPGGGTGAFQQAGDGTVSMEAEHFSNSVGSANYPWSQIAPAGASGAQAMLAPKSEQPRLEYQVSFNRTGTHYVYLRSYGSTSSSDSAWIGYDGNWLLQYVTMQPLLSWQWEGPVQINVTSIGMHTLGITRRESDTQVDKIVILTSANVPTGTGPIESPR